MFYHLIFLVSLCLAQAQAQPLEKAKVAIISAISFLLFFRKPKI
jgi:hypothetical protein